MPRKVNFTRSPMSSLLFHCGWLTTAQRLVFLWTRDHRLSGPCLRTLEMLVKFCLQFYFKMYFDIKVHHMIVDAPYHVLTSLRILKTVPKNVKDIFTFSVKTGAWYAHSEFLLLSLLSSPTLTDRQFAISQIKRLRGNADFGDNYVKPSITPNQTASPVTFPRLRS